MKLTEELIRKRQLQKLFEVFIGGPLHVNYQEGCRMELEDIEGQILAFDPVTREHEIELFKLRGEMRRLQWCIELFPNMLETLKREIDELESEDLNEVGAQPRKRDRYEDSLTSN
jgi:hypothetical protein